MNSLNSFISQVLSQVADAGEAIVTVSAPVITVSTSSPSLFSSLWASLATPTGISMALGSIVAVLTTLKFLNAQRKKIIALATGHAFYIVEDYVREAKKAGKGLPVNKLQEGLRIANEYMIANGWREIKPEEMASVKLGLQSIHGTTLSNRP